MSKVQPNHNRGIMQMGLDSPHKLCSKQKTKLWRWTGAHWRGWGGAKRSKKLATL